jgi:hypothetical protein
LYDNLRLSGDCVKHFTEDTGSAHNSASHFAAGTGESGKALTGLQQTQTPGRAAGLQALIGLLLLFRGNQGLAGIAALPNARPGDKLRIAAAALFRHRLLKRENARLLGQKMRIMEIAMIHVRHLVGVNDRSVADSRHPQMGEMAHEPWLVFKNAVPSDEWPVPIKPGIKLGYCSAPMASTLRAGL